MKVCGKALPPRAALLLTFDFMSFVLATPLLFMVPVLLSAHPKPVSALTLSLGRLMIAGLASQAVFYYSELYNLQVVRQPNAVLVRVLRAFAWLFLVLSLGCLVQPTLAPVISRVLLFSFFLALLVLSSRVLILPRKHERVLLISSEEEVADLQETISSCPEWNLEITEIIHPAHAQNLLPSHSDSHSNYDRIIVSAIEAQEASTLKRLLHWKLLGLPVEDSQGFYERTTGRVRVDGLTLSQCILSYNFENGAGKRRLKRLFDLVAASLLLIVTLPVIVAVAVLIAIQRDGTVLFKQKRIGLHGKSFDIYKFRTMRNAVPGHAPRWATEETHRISPLGAFLRKYRLDELLQLVNIFKGDMSLVGPRPEQPAFCEMLGQCVPFYDQRHTVPPGLTGWAQVRYHYGSSIEESKRKLEFDLFYVKHLSLWLDCAILIETIKVVLVGRGAR